MLATALSLAGAGIAMPAVAGASHGGVQLRVMTGSTQVRTAVDAGKSTDEVVAGWQGELTAFRALRAKYLIYPA